MIWRNLPIEIVKDRCLKHGVELVDQYTHADGKARFKCPFCGNLFSTWVRTVQIGRAKSCGCKRYRGSESKLWKGIGEISGHKFDKIKQSAKRKGISFNITIKDIWERYCQQNNLCYYTDIPISFKDNSASLDRIDNTLGYIIENICICNKTINFMKSDFDVNYFRYLCLLINKPIQIENNQYNIIFTTYRQRGGCGNITRGIYNYLIACAKSRNLEFSLEVYELWDLYIKQKGKCNITGLPINFPYRYKDERTASLDRIDNNKGYILENVQWIHKDVNRMKYNLNIDDFKNWASLVHRKMISSESK